MKSLLLLLAMLGTAYADTFPSSGPCEDVATCEAACAKTKKGTCYWGGVLVLQSAHEDRYQRALELFERGCVKSRDTEACYQVGRTQSRIDYEATKAAGPKTVAAYKRACDRNHARSCGEYAYFLREAADDKSKQQAPAIMKKAVQLLARRCLKDNLIDACGWAAYLYDEGKDVPKSTKVAAQLRAHACKLDARSCSDR